MFCDVVFSGASVFVRLFTLFAGVAVANQNLLRSFSVSAQREGYSKSVGKQVCVQYHIHYVGSCVAWTHRCLQI